MTSIRNFITSQWKTNPAALILLGIYVFIIALLPISTLFSVWIGSSIGSEELIKAWKEVLLLGAAILTLWVFYKDKILAKKILSRKVNILIAIYTALHLLVWVWQRPEFDAAVAGVLFNLRFLGIFLLAQIVIEQFEKKRIRKCMLAIVLVSASVVALFGAAQVLFLPDDFLVHFGYGVDTVKPFLSIDSNNELVRINSTTRGPNPLGAYMMSVILLSIAAWVKFPKWRNYILVLAPFLLITLYGSQSRSAWLGLFIGGLFGAIVWTLNKPKLRKKVLIAILLVALLIPSAWFALKDTSFYQVSILHDDTSNAIINTSDDARAQAQSLAIEKISEQPLGYGPGTNGHASNYSEDPQYAENYYLQIAHEVGLVGLAVLLGIIFFTMKTLWLQKVHIVPLAILSAFVGFLAVNLFLHSWGDDNSSMILWGMAGLYIGGYK